jgi:serine/threonine protein kinase
MHRSRRLPPHINVARVFGTFGATVPQPQQAFLVRVRHHDPGFVSKPTLCVVMERYSFTFDELRNERIRTRSSSTSQLFSEAEILHMASGLANGLSHLYRNGFVHR